MTEVLGDGNPPLSELQFKCRDWNKWSKIKKLQRQQLDSAKGSRGGKNEERKGIICADMEG